MFANRAGLTTTTTLVEAATSTISMSSCWGCPSTTTISRFPPWIIYGIQWRNIFRVDDTSGNFSDYRFTSGDSGNMVAYLSSVPFGRTNLERGASKPYGSFFWAGLPVKIQPDAWNFELEFNYCYAESMGRCIVEKSHRGVSYATQRANTRREGWLVKALAKYRTDD